METIHTFETILFTNIVERELMENKPSEIIPIAKYLGAETGLDVKTQLSQIVKEIIKCVKWN